MVEFVKKNVPSLVRLATVMPSWDSAFVHLVEEVEGVQNVVQNSLLDKTANKNAAVFGIIQRCVIHK